MIYLYCSNGNIQCQISGLLQELIDTLLFLYTFPVYHYYYYIHFMKSIIMSESDVGVTYTSRHMHVFFEIEILNSYVNYWFCFKCLPCWISTYTYQYSSVTNTFSFFFFFVLLFLLLFSLHLFFACLRRC